MDREEESPFQNCIEKALGAGRMHFVPRGRARIAIAWLDLIPSALSAVGNSLIILSWWTLPNIRKLASLEVLTSSHELVTRCISVLILIPVRTARHVALSRRSHLLDFKLQLFWLWTTVAFRFRDLVSVWVNLLDPVDDRNRLDAS